MQANAGVHFFTKSGVIFLLIMMLQWSQVEAAGTRAIVSVTYTGTTACQAAFVNGIANCQASNSMPTSFPNDGTYHFCICARTGQGFPPPGREEWAKSSMSVSVNGAAPSKICQTVANTDTVTIGGGTNSGKYNANCPSVGAPCIQAGDFYYQEDIPYSANGAAGKTYQFSSFAIYGNTTCTSSIISGCTSPPSCDTMTPFPTPAETPPPMIFRREIR